MDTGARAARNELFQVLKPRCVELSQLALRDDGSSSNTKSLIQSISQILTVLEEKRTKYTDRLAELTFKCLRILLEYGWSKSIPLDLAKQLLILLAFAAGGQPDQKSNTIPEEIVIEAYGSLAALFRDISVTPGGAAILTETGTIPALGHCVTVILDGITHGASTEVQLQALKALDGVWRSVKDAQALATFLPGTISGLTKYLMPSTADRRSRKTLINALVVLEHVFTSILSDVRTRNLRHEDQPSQNSPGTDAEQKVLTKSWLKATTGQIKLALSNIIRLRKHSAVDVRRALNRFCLTALDECHDTLSESAPLLVETCMILDGIDAKDSSSERGTSLTDLATIHTDLGELVKTTAYNWVTSLPRVMQANDESAKQSALDQLRRASDLLRNLNSDSSILEEALGTSLRDSVTVTLELMQPKALQEAEFDMNSQAAMSLVVDSATSNDFRPIVLAGGSQKETRSKLTELLSSLGTRESQINMAGEMLEYSVLLNSDESAYDWRMQAVALEVVAERAQRLKDSFQPELIDTLYSVAQLLGSPNENLREHAITCLNIVSKACGYTSASGLIIDNVDYMVNAISLRLNTFDISPQAPQVLVMMIRLAGPSLLLYLDDVVGSIFAALDNFHGYQRLVEVLFSVLDEIVKVGSKSPQMQITNTEANGREETEVTIPTIINILNLISKNSKASELLTHEDFPREPWKSAQTLLDEADAARSQNQDDQEEDDAKQSPAPPQNEIAAPPPNKTYLLLQSITRLSQHYLTSSSPHLRTKLLTLITTASTSLSQNSDQYLPLINDIWPVVLPLIHDPSPYVCTTALTTIAAICKLAGGFMATRISTEWNNIMGVVRKAKREMEAEKKAGRGIYGEARKKWEGVVMLLCAIVGWVEVVDEMVDEAIEVLGSLVWERDEVRIAMERANADAVWLACYVGGQSQMQLETPKMDEYEFVALNVTV
ncbi:hypothetical protein G7Y89_g11 [Cudoniella acicularis]|uniref:Uncharacterized protein n=1 Tax=Cudoniella acicularis TaxID=354080 RepID=A0A8H4W8Q0_9HELO|nr:hypothetical protein G7Y89_g11 [Cudoniella acicularis]